MKAFLSFFSLFFLRICWNDFPPLYDLLVFFDNICCPRSLARYDERKQLLALSSSFYKLEEREKREERGLAVSLSLSFFLSSLSFFFSSLSLLSFLSSPSLSPPLSCSQMLTRSGVKSLFSVKTPFILARNDDVS